MRYYIGIFINRHNNITIFHLVDKEQKIIYNGTSKIKEGYSEYYYSKEDDFMNVLKGYDSLIEINQKKFCSLLKYSYKYVKDINYIKFLKKEDLEEHSI